MVRLLAVGASVLLGLVVAEVALRVVGFSRPQLYRPDPRRGWGLDPGARGLWTEEGRAWIEVNRAGFRDDSEPPADEPAGTYRIALLGDSQAEALQVPWGATFGEVLERRLAECPDLPPGTERVEVLNFGVSGYGTAQALLTLRHQALAYDPDLVILAFYTGNDVRNNLRALELDPKRPYFELAPDGDLVLDDSFRATRAYRLRTAPGAGLAYGLLARSRLAQLAKAALSARRDQAAAEAARERAGDAAALAELGLDNAVYSPPESLDWQRAWTVTEALIAATAAESRAAGAGFALVVLTNGIQVHPDPAVRAAFAERLGVPDLLYPDRRLTRFARSRAIPVLPLVPPLRRLAEQRDLYLHGFTPPAADATLHGAPDVAHWNQGHWNEKAHQATGQLLARWLCGQPRLHPSGATPPETHAADGAG